MEGFGCAAAAWRFGQGNNGTSAGRTIRCLTGAVGRIRGLGLATVAGDGPVTPEPFGGNFVLALTQAHFNVLVEDHGPSLYRMAYRMVGDQHEAEDLVQETYRSAWKSRNRYETGRGDRAWLASILRRRVIDRWRRRRPPIVRPGKAPVDLSVEAEDPLANDFSDEMQRALGRLPFELRETLLLVVVTELTHQEAADLLGIPLGTVLSRVSRARRRLREFLLATAES